MTAREPEPTNWDFDVALSFSGEHRSFVRAVNNRLTEMDVAVFFDEEYQADMWGENLFDYLQTVYRTKARFVVAFASESYGTKAWPTLERQSAQARALREVGPFLLPVRLDDSELPGILPTIGYVDARVLGIDGLTELILKKLGKDDARPDDPVPLTQPEMERLKRDRPPGWEWFLFAGQLAQGKAALEDRWRDHSIGLRTNSAPGLANEQEVRQYIQEALSQVTSIVSNLDRIISVEMQEKAFGPAGVAGDWDLNIYMGNRFIALYEQLLTWASDVRSMNAPGDWAKCLELLSHYCDQPIEAVRAVMEDFVKFARSVPAYLAQPEPRPPKRVTLPLTFVIDPETSEAFRVEMQRLSS